MKKRLLALLLALALVCMIVPNVVSAKEADEDNLIKNGSFEEYKDVDGTYVPKNWVDKDGIWALEMHYMEDSDKDKMGEYFVWPKLEACEKSQIYQDVDITEYEVGQWFELKAFLCNYLQPPNDKATVNFSFLDKNNKVLTSFSRSQRNPKWIEQKITAEMPKNAVKIRVKLIATRYEGADNDGYFDLISLKPVVGKIEGVYITGDANTKAGKSTTLIANNGKSTDASLYDWSSSYDEWATVDKKGKVTLSEEYDAEEGVTIYATEKKTGTQAAFEFGNNAENQVPVMKVTGLKASVKTKTSITLKWAKSSGATKYTVYKLNPSTKKYEKVKTTTAAKLKVSKLKSGTQYSFKVIAEGKYGTETYTAAASSILKVKTK